jgi:hypothetical protein
MYSRRNGNQMHYAKVLCQLDMVVACGLFHFPLNFQVDELVEIQSIERAIDAGLELRPDDEPGQKSSYLPEDLDPYIASSSISSMQVE